MSVKVDRRYYEVDGKSYDIVHIMSKAGSVLVRRWGKKGHDGTMRFEKASAEHALTNKSATYRKGRVKKGYVQIDATQKSYATENELINDLDTWLGFGAIRLKSKIGHIIESVVPIGDPFEEAIDDEAIDLEPVSLEDAKADGDGYDNETWGTW